MPARQGGLYRPGAGRAEFGRGYPGNDEKGRELQTQIDPVKLMNDFFAAIPFLAAHPAGNGKVGITGFCYGGGAANEAAVAYPELGAAVPFYGRQPKAEEVPRIKAPLLLHYAERDTAITDGWPAYETALKAAGKTYLQIHAAIGGQRRDDAGGGDDRNRGGADGDADQGRHQPGQHQLRNIPIHGPVGDKRTNVGGQQHFFETAAAGPRLLPRIFCNCCIL